MFDRVDNVDGFEDCFLPLDVGLSAAFVIASVLFLTPSALIMMSIVVLNKTS